MTTTHLLAITATALMLAVNIGVLARWHWWRFEKDRADWERDYDRRNQGGREEVVGPVDSIAAHAVSRGYGEAVMPSDVWQVSQWHEPTSEALKAGKCYVSDPAFLRDPIAAALLAMPADGSWVVEDELDGAGCVLWLHTPQYAAHRWDPDTSTYSWRLTPAGIAARERVK